MTLKSCALVEKQTTTQVAIGLVRENKSCDVDYDKGYFSLIPVLRRRKLEDLYELKASLVYIDSSRPVKATRRDLVLKTNKHTKQNR